MCEYVDMLHQLQSEDGEVGEEVGEDVQMTDTTSTSTKKN